MLEINVIFISFYLSVWPPGCLPGKFCPSDKLWKHVVIYTDCGKSLYFTEPPPTNNVELPVSCPQLVQDQTHSDHQQRSL